MTIGFHYHIPIQIAHDGKHATQSFYGLFLDALARHCKELVIFSYEPVPSELPVINYTLTAKNITIISLGLHNALPFRLLRFGAAYYRLIKNPEIDIFLVRSPTPLTPVFRLLKNKAPVILYLVGDYVESGRALSGKNIKTLLIKALGHWVDRNQRTIARGNFVLSNSQLLVNEYSKIAREAMLVKSTTLSGRDFFYRSDTSIASPIKILYTGRLDPMKGLFEILEACEQLAHQGMNIEFHFAGLPVKGWEELPEILKEKAGKSALQGKVKYHGLKKVGDELNQLYRSADIYIIASKNFEGFPRTVWEAMANGLPVIATTVGSIPYFLVDGVDAVLVEPGSVSSIVQAISNLVSNVDLRKRLIERGYELAEENTLDVQAERMVRLLQDFLNRYE